MPPVRRRKTKKRKTKQKTRRKTAPKRPPYTRNVGIVIDSATPKAPFPAEYYEVDRWPTDIDYHSKKSLTLHFGKKAIEYSVSKFLGEGTFGYVSLIVPTYRDDDYPAYAYKRFFKVDAETRLEIKYVKDPRVRGVMVPAMAFGGNSVLMQLGIEVRDAKVGRENPDQVGDDVSTAVFQLEKKLIKQGLIYTDMKSANVLAVPVSGVPGVSRIMFADYGGLCPIKEKSCVYTYMLPERVRSYYSFGWTDKDKAELAARYWAGVVGMQVKGGRNYNRILAPDNRHGMSARSHELWMGRISDYANQIGGIPGRYLQPVPEERRTHHRY
jgi:hypothetical protein